MTASWALLRVARSLRRMPERLLHPWRRRAALRRVSRRPAPRFVLVVCHGNICRSPYAAALLRRELVPLLGDAVGIASAGFIGAGRPCPTAAVEVAAKRGLDLSKHRSRLVAPPEVHTADLIVVMDTAQWWAVRALFGRNARDLLVLGDLDPEAIETREIQDPVEQPQEVFERSYARIERCVRQLVRAGAGRAERRPSRGPAPLSQPELTT